MADQTMEAPSAPLIARFKPMEDYPDLPDYKVIYLIDVDLGLTVGGGAGLSIKLGDNGLRRRIKGNETLAEAVADVVGGTGDPKKFTKRHGNAQPHSPKPTSMSFRCNDQCFIIFRLPSNGNLRFTSSWDALSRDVDPKADFFTHPRRISDDGQIYREDPLNRGQNYLHAMFAYDGTAATAGGNSVDAIGRFNLHVDVVEDPGMPDSPRLPIIIDPDVRYPGGNGDP